MAKSLFNRVTGKKEQALTDEVESLREQMVCNERHISNLQRILSSIHELAITHSIQPGEAGTNGALKIDQIKEMTSAKCLKLESDDDEGLVEAALLALRERRGLLFDSVSDIKGTGLYKQIVPAVHRILFIIGDVVVETLMTEIGLHNVLQRYCGPKDILNMLNLINIMLTWIHQNPTFTAAMFLGYVQIIENSLKQAKQENDQEGSNSPASSPRSTASSPRSPRQEPDLLCKETNLIAKENHRMLKELLSINRERQQNRNNGQNA
ncbi:uncharacterized protein LOC127862583 [Dreissena polymorpha]|uniref:Uncharacterized protein n=1 Tax=Dreissena polymorpha TaxID=45954 RepID=A0A9D3Y986_DREPO|nr:uncharacterized protein LOC127862583 [Dreissena polymorpha]KAH3696153.1 hypothetical protein DPMN_083616 [Dreissena polymorpha]